MNYQIFKLQMLNAVASQVGAATLPTLFECIHNGDDEMRFECARAIADLAEAIDNRVAIVYGGLEQILMCMMSEDDQVQEQGKQRCRQTT